jgi:DNA-binding MarR family transcriptional regulator
VTLDKYNNKNVAELIEQLLLSFKPQICEESRLMELTLQQFRTLVLLYIEGPKRMSDISCQLGIGMPAVTSLVSKLEEKGLVTREHNTEDRRVVLCFATKQGKVEVERFWRIRKEQINRIVGSLNAEEIILVAKATETILRVTIDNQKVEPPQKQVVYPR